MWFLRSRRNAALPLSVSFILAAICLLPSLPAVQAQATASAAAAAATPATERAARLAALEKAIEAQRVALGIPGLSLVVVEDDKVILMKGFGMRNVAKKLPVTPDTLFAIGSSTKAFTAMTVMMAVDAGKMRLDDSPRRFLPYFTMRDPDTDAKITMRDLLSHRSGLSRTDLVMVAAEKFSREELIRVAGLAKPTAKLGEKFQYQNLMYAAAGEAVAQAYKKPWEQLVRERILSPLGMKATTLFVPEMRKAKDLAQGYSLTPGTKKTEPLPIRDIVPVAPAGAINSNARDMAQWLRLMLGGGVFENKRLVSEKSFAELTTKQITVGGPVGYGLGWFLRDWKGNPVAEHGGNIDGFNAEVGLMPGKKLGFVLLTNVSSSALGQSVLDIVWSSLLDPLPDATAKAAASARTGPATDPKIEVGDYTLAAAGLTITVAFTDGKLVMTVPGQPPYTLETVEGRRYKLAAPAPSGFFATFRAAKDDPKQTELYLEQPQGNFALTRKTAKADTAATAAHLAEPLKTLLGAYERDTGGAAEIVAQGEKLAFAIPGQPTRTLAEKAKDRFQVEGIPVEVTIQIERDAAGKVTGLTLEQPGGKVNFKYVPPFTSPLTADELLAKMITAAGGEAALRKHKTRVTTVHIDMENQGVIAEGTIYAKAPNAEATHLTLKALGKKIGTIDEYFDGKAGGDAATFSPIPSTKDARELKQDEVQSDFYSLLSARNLFAKIEIKRLAKVDGEEAYVVVKTPKNGANPITEFVSTRTFLLLRRDLLQTSASGAVIPITETFRDYRAVDGVQIAFTSAAQSPTMGSVVTRVQDVRFDVPVKDDVFRGPAKK